MIYLDNCATTKPSPSVIKQVALAMERDFANPSSLHSFGHDVEREISQIRREVKSYLGAKSGEVIFTSGGTESNNMALNCYLDSKRAKGTRVITSNIEHPSVLEFLRAREDIDLIVLPVGSKGRLSLKEIMEVINENSTVLSLFHVNNELGSIHDLEVICQEIKAIWPQVNIHIDGVQAVGKIPVNLSRIPCDSYSFSAHKFHGPKGIGGLYIANKDKFKGYLLGGGQEYGLRSGTYNSPGIYGMGQAFKELGQYKVDDYKRIQSMKDYMIHFFEDNLQDIRINSFEPASPFLLNISIADTRGEVLLHILEQEGIFISTSSACSSHRTGSNPVLEAIGLDENYREGTIRICLSLMNQMEEIETFCHSLIKAVAEVRNIIRRK